MFLKYIFNKERQGKINSPISLSLARFLSISLSTSAFCLRLITNEELSQKLWNSFRLLHFPQWWFCLSQRLLLPHNREFFDWILTIVKPHVDYNPTWRTATSAWAKLTYTPKLFKKNCFERFKIQNEKISNTFHFMFTNLRFFKKVKST